MNTAEISKTFETPVTGVTNRKRVVPKRRGASWQAFRLLGAGGLTILLLFFLTFTRWLNSQNAMDLSIRSIQGLDPLSVQAPPPPPPPSEPPPPPPPDVPPLPKLEIQLNSIAPPIKATTDPQVDLTMMMPDFSREVEQPRQRMLFSSKELDQQPRLVNRPSATFPRSQLARGVREGKVTLEVAIDPSGKVSIRRVIDSSHPDFTAMAKSFASRARFTSPKKDGRSVTAIFRWPLILRP